MRRQSLQNTRQIRAIALQNGCRLYGHQFSRLLLAIGVIWAIGLGEARAAEPAGVVAPDVGQTSVDLLAIETQNAKLAEHAPAAGWKLEKGVLTADEKSTPLATDCVLHDFELHIGWKVTNGAAIKLDFLQTPANENKQSFAVRLAETPGITLRLPEGARNLKVDPDLLGKLHQTVIRRTRGELRVDNDGTKSRGLPIAADTPFGLTLQFDAKNAESAGTIESLRLLSNQPSPVE